MVHLGFIMFHSNLMVHRRRRPRTQVLMDRVAKLMTLLQTLRETFVKAGDRGPFKGTIGIPAVPAHPKIEVPPRKPWCSMNL